MMASSMALTTTLYDENGETLQSWKDVQELPVLRRGDGIVMPGGRRFRVVDAWLSFDAHGRFHTGWHVFLAPVVDYDDRLRHLAPSYYV